MICTVRDFPASAEKMKQENLQKAIVLRRELHRHPELSGREEWTREHLKVFLRRNTSLRIVDRGRWFYAWYNPASRDGGHGNDRGGDRRADGGDGLGDDNGRGDRQDNGSGPGYKPAARSANKPGIAFRADFDALPIHDDIDADYRSVNEDVGHKCGHDGHAATLAALALEVDREGADRNVYFLFQHAEETGEGAKECLDLFAEHEISEIYAWHNMPGICLGTAAVKSGTMHFASKGLSMYFTGKESHASLPEEGINPSYAVARIIRIIEELSERKDFAGLVLITIVQVDIGKEAFGTAAGEGVLRITLRAKYEDELAAVQKSILAAAEEESRKASLDFSFEESDVFFETVNDPESVDKLKKVCEVLDIPVIDVEKPFRASEDFGQYLKECRGCIFFIGDGEESPKLHTREFDFPDAIIEPAVELMKGLIAAGGK